MSNMRYYLVTLNVPQEYSIGLVTYTVQTEGMFNEQEVLSHTARAGGRPIGNYSIMGWQEFKSKEDFDEYTRKDISLPSSMLIGDGQSYPFLETLMALKMPEKKLFKEMLAAYTYRDEEDTWTLYIPQSQLNAYVRLNALGLVREVSKDKYMFNPDGIIHPAKYSYLKTQWDTLTK